VTHTTLCGRTWMHLGYTGTMLCGDPDREVAMIFLTNRVCTLRCGAGHATLNACVRVDPTDSNGKIRYARIVRRTRMRISSHTRRLLAQQCKRRLMLSTARDHAQCAHERSSLLSLLLLLLNDARCDSKLQYSATPALHILHNSFGLRVRSASCKHAVVVFQCNRLDRRFLRPFQM
jgi:hypothetical protein